MQQKSLFYLKKANKIALNSKDQSTKVGAFILDEEEISPLGFGYNGMPRGLPDDDKEKNNELKEEETRLNLIEYLKNKKLNGEFITDNNFNNLDNLDRLDHFDNLLWVYLNEELQQKLQEELNKIK